MRNEMMAKIGNAVGDWLGGAKSALTAVREAEESKRHEYERAMQEQSRLRSAPAPKAEIVQRLKAEVRAIGEAWLQTTAQNLIGLGGRLELNASGEVSGITHSSSLWDCVVVDLGFACCMFPDAITTKLASAIERLDYPEGPAMQQRAGLLRALDEKITELAQQHENLVHAAHEVGLEVQELPENKRRRLKEAREREQRELAELQRRATAGPGRGLSPQARLDAQIELERRQRGARS